MSAPVDVRPATAGDARRLLDWANDPVTRAASFRTAPIGWPEHERWLAGRLASPSCRLLIGLEGLDPVGHVRFELGEEGTAEVGISLDPGVRGRGLGTALLRAAISAARGDPSFSARSFVARVRVDNAASIRLFLGAGFHPLGESFCEGVPCLRFELDA